MRLANGAAASSASPSGAPSATACGVAPPTADSLPRADPETLLRSRHFVTSMSRLAEGIIMHDLPPTLWSELPAPHAPSAVSALQQRLCSREKAAFFAPDRVGEIKEKRQQRLAHCCEVFLFLYLTTHFSQMSHPIPARCFPSLAHNPFSPRCHTPHSPSIGTYISHCLFVWFLFCEVRRRRASWACELLRDFEAEVVEWIDTGVGLEKPCAVLLLWTREGAPLVVVVFRG